MADATDAKSFVLRSEYRTTILKVLWQSGQLTPSEIAEQTDIRQPHVSRALSELRERDLVTLAVPDSQPMGRLYELSEFGAEVRSELDLLDWRNQVEDVPPAHREFVRFLHRQIGETVSGVGHYDGDTVSMYYLHDRFRETVSDDEFLQMSETLIDEFSHTGPKRAEIMGKLRYEVQAFTEYIRIVIYTPDGVFMVALKPACRFEFPSLIEDCLEILHPGQPE
jgi:DNA-binding transcriptional ArsR family regulator